MQTPAYSMVQRHKVHRRPIDQHLSLISLMSCSMVLIEMTWIPRSRAASRVACRIGSTATAFRRRPSISMRWNVQRKSKPVVSGRGKCRMRENHPSVLVSPSHETLQRPGGLSVPSCRFTAVASTCTPEFQPRAPRRLFLPPRFPRGSNKLGRCYMLTLP